MILFKILLLIYTLCGLLYWLMQLFLTLRVMKSVPLLEKLPYDKSRTWPKVSVIIPACNEAKTIEDAMQSRLQDDYPNLEILLIDDRSTDRTGEIVDKIAAKDSRVKAIHISELPEGWVGKPYALDQGAKLATGDWLLFSDADVYIKPTAIKRAITYCESRKLDHLTIFPELYQTRFLLDTLLSLFIRWICLMARVWAVEDEKSNASAGAGAFNLVRRSALEKIKGFEALRLEVADDVALGQVLKKSGARSSLINGRHYVGIYFYRSIREAAIGSERAGFTTIGNFSSIRLALIGIILFGLEMSSFIILVPMGIPYLPILGLIMVSVVFFVSISMNKWLNRPILPSLFLPIGITISTVLMFRTGILGVKRGGIYWRGTFYPTSLLKSGRRYKF